ncbi:hypothetical protein FRC06_006594 [Ceratobasidium sp. 370]|nr:hypothetical protein FRC06_006594 [Ceratobasidium sp. 370]
MAIAYSFPSSPTPADAFVFAPNPNSVRCPEIMIDLRLPPVPADLKHVLPFLQRAQEVRARDPYVCYWSLYYVAHLGVGRPKTKENKPFLAAVVDQLEGMKRTMKNRRQITDEAAGSLYIRRFGFNVFEAANNEDIQGNTSRATAKKFLAASYFLEILRLFGPLDVEASAVEETIKYAKFKAADIVRSLREGVTPTPGIPAVPARYTTNGHTLTPSNLSPQTNPILLSTRPSTLQSPAESPTTGAPRPGPLQPNYPPARTESGSGSAPVSPRHTPVKASFSLDGTRQEIKKPESSALPTSGSGGQAPFPGTSSPKKRQSPIPRYRSPLAAPDNASPKVSPVSKPKVGPAAAKLASPVKAPQDVSATPPPGIQQLPPQLPPAGASYAAEPWIQPGAVSPTMSSAMTMDSTDTFTSSQLQTVIRSGSMAILTAPRAQSPDRAQSVASTDQSESRLSDSRASEETGTVNSPLMPVLTVVDVLTATKEIEVAAGTEEARTSNLVTIASPVMDDWDLGREVSRAIRELTPPAPPAVQSWAAEVSPLALARSTPIPDSPDAGVLSTPTQTPAAAPLSLVTVETAVHPARAEPAVVVPRSPTQPSPTSNISPNSPSTISPASLDMALAQNQSFRTAAELIDAELWKVYGKLDVPAQEFGAVGQEGYEDEGIDIEVESGSSLSSGSTGSSSSGSEEEAQSGASSDEESEGQSVVSEVKVMSTEVSLRSNGESVRRSSGYELKSLIKTSKGENANGGAQFEAVVARKTVRFAPSVVGGLSPEVPRQILPPLTPASRTSPSLPIIPSSMVVHASQPLVRPKSLTIRSSVETDHQQPSSMSPNSPTYTPHMRSSGLVGLPPLVDGRPPEDFAIIPFHPSMSASHPAPAVQNNPAYAPPSATALVRTPWTSSPPLQASTPYRRPAPLAVDRETAALAQKYSRFAISSLNYMDVEAAKQELRAALALLEGET